MTVLDEYPPNPFVTSHSRDKNAFTSPFRSHGRVMPGSDSSGDSTISSFIGFTRGQLPQHSARCETLSPTRPECATPFPSADSARRGPHTAGDCWTTPDPNTPSGAAPAAVREREPDGDRRPD